MDISKINKQLPPIFNLRIEDNKLELYTIGFSEVVTSEGKDTKSLKRFRTICEKKNIDGALIGMQTILDIFYTLNKEQDAKT